MPDTLVWIAAAVPVCLLVVLLLLRPPGFFGRAARPAVAEIADANGDGERLFQYAALAATNLPSKKPARRRMRRRSAVSGCRASSSSTSACREWTGSASAGS